MPITRKPSTPATPYRDQLAAPYEPGLDDSPAGAALKAFAKHLMDSFTPTETDLPLMGMAGRAPRMKGFTGPGGKVIQTTDQLGRPITPVTHEGEAAARALTRMTKGGINKQLLTSGEVPTVSDPSHLSDVAVPIADSLDTAATPKMPLLQQVDRQSGASKSKAKLSADDVWKIRELYDAGTPMTMIARLFPQVNPGTISEAARRASYAKLGDRPKTP